MNRHPAKLCLSFAVFATCAALGACRGDSPSSLEGQWSKADPNRADSSAIAVFLEFEFDGSLLNTRSWGTEQTIESQLLYTVGQLNGARAVSRLDKVVLSNVQSKRLDSGKYQVTYHAKVVVAWGSRDNVPATYELVLPKDMSFDAQDAFIDAYAHTCVEWGAHDVDRGTMWYYWRPLRYNCDAKEEELVRAVATVRPSEIATTGKYPEYHEVWKDDTLKVVAVFGKYEEGAVERDEGIEAYNHFVRLLSALASQQATEITTIPEQLPDSPGVETPDVTLRATLPDGKRLEVVALLVDSVRSAGRQFDERYEALSGDADLIAYNGHSGLGANIRYLARQGSWKKGQYAVVFMNGCDTYAYVDSALADAHRAVNPDDATGYKYVDVVTNAMPSHFSNMAQSTMALIEGLLDYKQPKTYEAIFGNVSSSQIILVSGEDDNVYVPGYDPGKPDPEPAAWQGMSESGTVTANREARFATEQLPAGIYRFTMTGDHDADLYVRIGLEPTTRVYDCRPFKNGSNETCQIELNTPTIVHVMVRGWAPSSSYTLEGKTVHD